MKLSGKVQRHNFDEVSLHARYTDYNSIYFKGSSNNKEMQTKHN